MLKPWRSQISTLEVLELLIYGLFEYS